MIFKLLMSQVSLRSIIDATEIGTKTLYDKIDFFYDQCRKFSQAKEKKISKDMLHNEDFIDLMPDSPLRKRVDEVIQTESKDRRTVVEMGTMRGACALVDRGVGVAIVDPFAELLLAGTSVVSKRLVPRIEWDLVFLTPDGVPVSQVSESMFTEIQLQVARLKGMGILEE